jgi:hypothetical protein
MFQQTVTAAEPLSAPSWSHQKPLAHWVRLIRAEYLEIPGLVLTPWQVQRLWSLDSATCDAVLDVLTDVRFLKRTRNGAYVLAAAQGR